MTLIVSWIGADNHGTSSAYIMSESRISWPDGVKYDYGKKVFASKNYPELFGYAGDVLFPSVVLSQIIEMIDSGILFNDKMSCKEKCRAVLDVLGFSLAKYPYQHKTNRIQILYITRETIVNTYPTFHCYLLDYDRDYNTKKAFEEIPIPQESGLVKVLGSGKRQFEECYKLFQKLETANTSRNVFQCFVQTLDQLTGQNDEKCGGSPQLVGLYRKPQSYGRNYGILFKGKRYMLGMELHNDYPFNNVEWRNEQFEICDGKTKSLYPGATKQPFPNIPE